MRPSCLFFILGIPLVLGCGLGFAEQSRDEGTTFATFDGGVVTLLDIDAMAAKYYSRSLLEGQRAARAQLEARAGGLEVLAKRVARDRILAQAARQHGVPLGVTREQRLQVQQEKILANIFFNSVGKAAIERAREDYDRRCRERYEKNAHRYPHPAQWTFRHILIGKPIDAQLETELTKRPKRNWNKTLLNAEERARYEQQAQEIYERCRRGEDFLALAREYSAGPPERRGHLIGPTNGSHYSPQVAAALQKLATGELSPPTETPFGFMILRCEAYRPPCPKTFEEALPAIQEELGAFSRRSAVLEAQRRLATQYRPQRHPENLSRDPARADAVVMGVTVAQIRNRDVFRPDLARYLQREEPDEADLMDLVKMMYRRRLYSVLARKEGLHNDPIASRALQLTQELAFAGAMLSRLKDGEQFPGLPPFQEPLKTYYEQLLEKNNFQLVEQPKGSLKAPR